MTDKITTAQAIQHLKNTYACGSAEPSKCLDTKCDKCEYRTDPNIEEEVFRVAIEALEYRESRKVTGEKNRIKHCPRCGHPRGIRWNGDYCPNCGQAISWEDEE